MNVEEIMTMVRQYGNRPLGTSVTQRQVDLAEIEAAIKALVPDPNVLTLPTPPPGTVALIGVESGRRYTPPSNDSADGSWYNEESCRWHDSIAEVLLIEAPWGVRAELTTPPAPRTVAAIWASLGGEARYVLMQSSSYAELAEALDREAGLA